MGDKKRERGKKRKTKTKKQKRERRENSVALYHARDKQYFASYSIAVAWAAVREKQSMPSPLRVPICSTRRDA